MDIDRLPRRVASAAHSRSCRKELATLWEGSSVDGVAPDAAVVALHISAIGRTARDTDALSHMNDVVAKELAGLAARKLAESRTKLIKR